MNSNNKGIPLDFLSYLQLYKSKFTYSYDTIPLLKMKVQLITLTDTKNPINIRDKKD